MMSLVSRRKTLRRTTVALLPPIAFFLCGGPTASNVYAAERGRREKLLEVARNQGIDPQLLLDPQGYAETQQAEAHTRRAAALAKLPKQAPSRAQQEEFEDIRKRQAPHTLAGWARDAAAGHKRPLPDRIPPALAPVVRRVAAAHGAELARMVASPRRPIPRRSSPPPARQSSQAVQASKPWRIDPALRDVGGALQNAPAAAGVPVAPRGVLPVLTSILQMALEIPTPADTATTPEAPKDHPDIVAQALELGHDPLRIYNFVHDTIETEVYFGSKKGAVGTLHEGAGNDWDQASLLIALLRASGVATRYEYSTMRLSPAQAMSYAGTETVGAALDALASAGVPVLGEAQGSQFTRVRMDHAFVRAYLPYANYRGLPPSSGGQLWVSLDPSIKRTEVVPRVDLSTAVTFNHEGYLSAPQAKSPLDTYEDQLRSHVRANNLECATLDAAMVRRRILPDRLPLLPGTPPAPRLVEGSFFSDTPTVPSFLRHMVTFSGPGYFGATRSVAELWGKRVSLVYDPPLSEDEPWSENLRPILQIEDDPSPPAPGSPVAAGTPQLLTLRFDLPGRGTDTIDHTLLAGGRYAIGLDAGKVPESLLAERRQKLGELSGDEQENEKLHVAALSYLREQELARDRATGLHGARSFQDTEETLVGIEPQITTVGGVPLTVNGHYGVMDAARIHAGYYGVTVADTPLVSKITTVKGFQSSYLEHVVLERFVGSQGYSAVKLVQLANGPTGQGVNVIEPTDDVESELSTMNISEDYKDQIRIQHGLGRKVWAPNDDHDPTEPALPLLYGFIARDPSTGEALYAVNSMFGGASGAGGAPSAPEGQGSGSGCPCNPMPAPSQADPFSGNYTFSVTDLTLPARGIPLTFTRTYNSQLGWTHNYRERLGSTTDPQQPPPAPGSSLAYVDEFGMAWTFDWDGVTSEWKPPPKRFERIKLVDGVYEMTFKDGLVHEFNSSGQMTLQRDLNGNSIVLTHVGGGLDQVTVAGGTRWFLFAYDPADGYLVGVSDSAGRSVSFVNDDAGRITEESDVLDQDRLYTYDPVTGWMRTKTAFRDDAIVWKMDYDDHGRIVRAEYPDGNARTYAYDFAAKKTLYTDRDGATTLYELSDLAQPVRIVDALGNEQAMSYNARGLKTSEQDARGNLTTFDDYDDNGNLLHKTDPLTAVTEYTYLGPSRLATTTVHHTPPQGPPETYVTTNDYDDNAEGGTWNLMSTTDPLTKVTSYHYTDGLVDQITRPGPATTEFTYFADGSVNTIQDPEGGQTTMTYDTAGHLQTITAPNSPPRTLVIDAKGQLASMTDGMDQTTSFVYDHDGNRTQVVAPDGDGNPNNNPTTTFVYDDVSRLAETIDAEGNVTRQEYDAEDRVTARIDARGYRTTMAYDALGRLVETCDPLGNCTTMGYCAELAQQACLTIDALGNVTEIEEDVLGRETARIDPLGNRTETNYDDLGRRDTVKDPSFAVTGKLTRFVHDPLGRLTSVRDEIPGKPVIETVYGYDDRGNRTSVEDANDHTTLFEYDLANRLTKETTPINTVTEFTYYPDGSREKKIDGEGQVTKFEYNANRQPTKIWYDFVEVTPSSAESTAEFDYDARGNKTFEQGIDSTRTMTYHVLGRVDTVEDVELGRLIDYDYDAVGNRTKMTVSDGDPANDEVTKYVWDGRGLLTHLIDPEKGEYRFRYDALGHRISTTYPNGMTLQTTYDAASQVAAMVYSHPARGVLQSFTYPLYDERGNRKSKVLADGTAELYGYDELSRLTSVDYTASGRHVEYAYDPVGNRQVMTEQLGSTPPQTTDYAHNEFNQLTSLVGPGGETTFEYDLDGNQTWRHEPGGADTQFVYDARDRMTEVVLPNGGGTSTFGYDTQNLRVYMNDSQGERRVLLDGIEEYAEIDSGATTARYDHDPSRIDALLAQNTSAGKVCAIGDALGSVYGLTDAVGLDRARYSYDAYGGRTATLEQVPTAWGFTGRRYETGTADTAIYYRARYYSATVGTFEQPDPIATAALTDLRGDPRTAAFSVYAYVRALPSLLVDPRGLFPEVEASCGDRRPQIMSDYTRVLVWVTRRLANLLENCCTTATNCLTPCPYRGSATEGTKQILRDARRWLFVDLQLITCAKEQLYKIVDGKRKTAIARSDLGGTAIELFDAAFGWGVLDGTLLHEAVHQATMSSSEDLPERYSGCLRGSRNQ